MRPIYLVPSASMDAPTAVLVPSGVALYSTMGLYQNSAYSLYSGPDGRYLR
jgi:hypothetical protein